MIEAKKPYISALLEQIVKYLARDVELVVCFQEMNVARICALFSRFNQMVAILVGYRVRFSTNDHQIYERGSNRAFLGK